MTWNFETKNLAGQDSYSFWIIRVIIVSAYPDYNNCIKNLMQ